MTREDRAYGWIHRNVIDRLSSNDTLIRKNDIKMTDATDAMKVNNSGIPIGKKSGKQLMKDIKRAKELNGAIERRFRNPKGFSIKEYRNIAKVSRRDKLTELAKSESNKMHR